MEKNTVNRAKKVKGLKKPKPAKLPKQKKESRSAKKQRVLYEKALKKARPEKFLSLVAVGLAVTGAVAEALIEQKNIKEREKKTETK